MIDIMLILLSCGIGDYINKGILIGLFFVFAYQAMVRRRVLLNAIRTKAFWILALFGLYFSIVGFGSLSDLKRFFVAPLLMYLSGWVIAERRGSYQSTDGLIEIIEPIFLSIMVGYSVHALLNYSVNIGRERWLLIDYYSGSFHSATGLGMINTMAFSILVYIFLEKNFKRQLVAGWCFAIAIVYGLQVGSRTQLVIFLAITLVCLLFFFREIDHAKGLRITIVIVIVLSAILYAVFKSNFMGISTKIEASNLFYRVNADTTHGDRVRVERLVQGIQSLLNHPFGDATQPYFHNMWLDAGRVAGTLAFVLLALYSIITYYHAFLIVHNQRITLSFRVLLLGIYLGLAMNYFVEPVLEGMTEHFYVFCLMNGAIEYFSDYMIRSKEFTKIEWLEQNKWTRLCIDCSLGREKQQDEIVQRY